MAARNFRTASGERTLFDPSVKKSPGPRLPLERAFEFYDRVEGELWDDHRSFVDRCFRALPKAEQAQVRGQWRGGQDDQLAACWWEMLLHESLLTSGLKVRGHVESDSGTRADFAVVGEGVEDFYVEAHQLGPSSQQRDSRQRLDDLYAALGATAYEGWRFHLIEVTVGAEPKDFSDWIGEVDAWLQQIPRERGHELLLEDGDWAMRIGAIPHESSGHPHPRPIGIYPIVSGVSGYGEKIRKPVLHKIGRYPGLSPLIVAVAMSAWDMNEEDIVAALCGVPVFHLGEDLNLTGVSRAGDGLWIGPEGPRNQHIAGIILGTATSPGDLLHQRVEYWPNPWARAAVSTPCGYWETVTIDPESGEVNRHEAPQTIRSFFELPDTWGSTDPFPDVAAWRRSRL